MFSELIKGQRAVAGLHRAPEPQPPLLRRRWMAGGVFDDDPCRLARQLMRGGQCRSGGLMRVGRIDDDQIEWLAGKPRGGVREAWADDSTVARTRRVDHGKVLLDQSDRARILLDEGDARRAAAQRLDADRAGAGIAVEHARAGDRRPDDVEQRLAQAIRCRPEAVPRRRRQLTAAIFARYDS